MFTRATSRSYTCLKCQYRLAVRESARIDFQNTNTQVPRRWQTSAASAAVEEDYEKDEASETPRDFVKQQESRPYYSRRWRPTPTANIGADVLGKPAEILLLPARKRRRSKTLKDVDEGPDGDVSGQVVPEKTKDQPQLKIHEALAQESKPTSRKDVIQNIERLREEARNNAVDGSLPADKWMESFNALSKGFTRKQLSWYLEENAGALQARSPAADLQLMGPGRARTATQILTEIWGFTNDAPRDQSGHISGFVNLGRGRRELILGVDKEWRRFLQHVSIEPSSTPGRVEIAGPEAWVIRARAVFGSLKKRVCSRTMNLPTVYAKALRDRESSAGIEARSILQELIQKYEITMTKETGWTAHAFSMDRIDRFERELIQAQRQLFADAESSAKSLFLSPTPVDMASVVPVYKDTLDTQPPKWYRYFLPKVESDTAAADQDFDTESDAFRTLFATLKTKFYNKKISTLNIDFSHATAGDIGNVATEHSITIGQALHKSQELDQITTNESASKAGASQYTFTPAIPLLRQFLARQEVYSSQKDKADANISPLCLRFMPSDTRSCPEIELQATISESANALEMNIVSVKLIFSSDTAYVALPTTPNDLELTRVTSVSIFQHGVSVQKLYAPLLGQLASQVRVQDQVAEDSSRLHLNKLLDLDLSCLEMKAASKTAGASKRKGKSDDVSAVRYALHTAEVIEKRTYRIPGQDRILLEYTSNLPMKVSAKQKTLEHLRVVPTETIPIPAGKSVEKHEEKFVEFVKSAVRVVENLDRFVAEKTKEMVDGNEA